MVVNVTENETRPVDPVMGQLVLLFVVLCFLISSLSCVIPPLFDFFLPLMRTEIVCATYL